MATAVHAAVAAAFNEGGEPQGDSTVPSTPDTPEQTPMPQEVATEQPDEPVSAEGAPPEGEPAEAGAAAEPDEFDVLAEQEVTFGEEAQPGEEGDPLAGAAETPEQDSAALKEVIEVARKQAAAENLSSKEVKDIEQNLRRAFLRTQSGRSLLASRDVLREVEKPVTEGGVGFRPTHEQIVDMYKGSAILSSLRDDLLSGDANRSANAIHYMFGSPEHIGANANQIGQYFVALQNSESPVQRDAYQKFAAPVVSAVADDLYRQAASASDSKAKRRLHDAAAIIDFQSTGHHRQMNEQTGEIEPTAGAWAPGRPNGQPGAQPQGDPLANERAALEAERTRLAQDRATAVANDFRDTTTGYLQVDCDNHVLKGLEQRLGAASYQANRDKFLYEVMREVDSDPALLRSIQAAISPGTRESVQAAANMYRDRARSIMVRKRPEFLKALKPGANGQVASQSANAPAPPREVPGSGGRPVTPAASQSNSEMARRPGEDHYAYVRRMVAGQPPPPPA